jgi:Protein of unknown function (DUF2778)
MWTFIQSTGAFLRPDGSLLTTGYSGHWDGVSPPKGPKDHRNKPADQTRKDLGPIPVGGYTIGRPHNDIGGKGPVVMDLTPDPGNQMFGRDDFMIHGDRALPRSGTASDGCIVLDFASRRAIAVNKDRDLRVISAQAIASLADLVQTRTVPAPKKTAKKAVEKAIKVPSTRTKKSKVASVSREKGASAKKPVKKKTASAPRWSIGTKKNVAPKRKRK